MVACERTEGYCVHVGQSRKGPRAGGSQHPHVAEEEMKAQGGPGTCGGLTVPVCFPSFSYPSWGVGGRLPLGSVELLIRAPSFGAVRSGHGGSIGLLDTHGCLRRW